MAAVHEAGAPNGAAPETDHAKRILFSGLTASSKTTYSKLVAESAGRPWFDATTLLKQLAGLAGISNELLWVTDVARDLQAARQGDTLDRRLDQQLLERTRRTPDAVVDAWAMPWLWEDEAVRVLVQADLDTRVQRCMGSCPPDSGITAAAAEQLIIDKDNYTRELFQRLYGFDLFNDHEDFDVILDTSGFIPDTPEKRGVQIATERFFPAARYAISLAGGLPRPDRPPEGFSDTLASSAVVLKPELILPGNI